MEIIFGLFRLSRLIERKLNLLFASNMGSRARLVMRIVHSRRPLALASLSREFAMTRATISRSQADLVLFLITKRDTVGKPRKWGQVPENFVLSLP